MKKSIFVLLMVALSLCVLFVSCNSDVTANQGDNELVSVSFDSGSSKGLTATVEGFDVNAYYWYYAAKKTDSTGLISGETTSYNATGAIAVKADKGLSGAQVPGFSQGIWKFTLYAYKEVPTTDTKANYVYYGEATDVVLKKGGDNTARVVASPRTDGNGYLVIMDSIALTPHTTSTTAITVPKQISITTANNENVVLTTPTNLNTGVQYELAAGSYKVTVDFEFTSLQDPNQITYATGYVIATVYPGLVTTVSGDLSELITYAQFDAEENPDIIRNIVAESGSVDYATTMNELVFEKTVSTETGKKINVKVPGDSAKAIADVIANEVGVSTTGSSIQLKLNVDTTAATAASVTYEIGMEAVLTQGSQSYTSTVSSVASPVTVVIDMERGLANVGVSHSGVAMTKADTLQELTNGKYFYDTASGKLYICTSSFSPFAVSYTVNEFVAAIGDTKYKTLPEAVRAALALEGDTVITLLKDASGEGFSPDDADHGSYIIDFNGHTYNVTKLVGSTGTVSQAWRVIAGQTVVLKNGTLTSSNARMLINQYGNLTLENIILDGTQLDGSGRYVLSNNSGTTTIKGTTKINAKTGDFAFDVWGAYNYGSKSRVVTFDEGFTGSVTGKIEYCANANGNDSKLIVNSDSANCFSGVSLVFSSDSGSDIFSENSFITFKFDPKNTILIPNGYTAEYVDNVYKIVKNSEL